MRSSRRKVAALAVAVTTGLVVSTVAAVPAVADNPNNSQKMRKAVKVENIMGHLEELQAVADEHGSRAAGEPGYEASAEYIESQLRAAGYEPERQYFDFAYFSEKAPAELERTKPSAVTYETGTFTYSGSGDVTAPVHPVDLKLDGDRASTSGCEAADFTGFPAGSIALVQRGACNFGDKAANADAAGASAVIIFNQGNDPTREGVIVGTLGGIVTDLPVVGASFAAGEQLSLPGTEARVFTDTESDIRETFNVFAETDSGRDDNVVMLGSHLDSVSGGPGINDNGTGSASILETAVQLAKANKLNNKVRFAWWGAEELGLLGSWHYVDDLVANDPEELDEIATYLNFDMVGSPNYMIGVYDADRSTYPAADVPIPEGSEATEDVFTEYFDSSGQPWVDTEFSGRSDYQGFIYNGVPASGLFTGADGVKTPEQVQMFGGDAGVIYDPNYHTPEDDISNVDATALDIMSDAIAHAAISLAQDTSLVNGARSAGKSGMPHPVLDQPAA